MANPVSTMKYMNRPITHSEIYRKPIKRRKSLPLTWMMATLSLLLLLNTPIIIAFQHPSSFVSNIFTSISKAQLKPPSLLLAKDNSEKEDAMEEEEEIDLSDRDWRAFRAKLVMQPETQPSTSASNDETIDEDDDDIDGIGAALSSSNNSNTNTNSQSKDPTKWAYDSGNIIEKGAVILGGVEQDFGFGLRQQYFHKVVMLVLDYDEPTFTKGIILNRPTDTYLDDKKEWKVWFGGDVQGFDTLIPQVVCLHSITDVEDDGFVKEVSETILNDIMWTSFENAKKIVEKDLAKPSGYAGWGPNQLQTELERKSWYMLSTDSQTLLQELARQSRTSDPRDAGLDTWEQLMCMISKEKAVLETRNEFDDLMLKEWAREKLCAEYNVVKDVAAKVVLDGVSSTQDLLKANEFDRLIKRASDMAKGEDVMVGSILRASSAYRSPFLLNKQEFHKSILLVIADDDNLTVGVMLNQPAAKGLGLEVVDRDSRARTKLTIPLRYGGEYMVKGQDQLLWLHACDNLRKAKIGAPVNPVDPSRSIWKCSSDQATSAMAQGLASTTDFMVISGVSVWTKGEKGLARGMQGEIRKGSFKIVQPAAYQHIWGTLQKQELLSKGNLSQNLLIANSAWILAAGGDEESPDEIDDDVLEGIGEGFDEDNDNVVFKSDVKVASLSDDALRSWIATFLLGAPTLG